MRLSRRSPDSDVDALADAVLNGDRRALARAITLVESTRADHRAKTEALLARLLPHTGGAVRIGVSGAPGVGKSTFIEAFGLYLIDGGHRLAVLAVDPSSRRSGGSILGDKTRMGDLARVENAFIRPSPSGGTLGGVARRTREAGLACEAAGFDVVLVETVGVGQSETAVADMVDLFLLLLPPAGGDELQGLKKGIVELADIIAVNKADGDLKLAAARTAAEYTAAMPLIRGALAGWRPPVLQISALERRGMETIWQAIERYQRTLGPARLAAKRRAQATAWMWNEIEEGLLTALKTHRQVAKRLASLEAHVSAGQTTPTAAAQAILAAFRGDK